MNTILIGNVITIIGAAVMIATGFIKSRKNILSAQCVQFGIMGIGNFVLGGTTGFITNAAGIVRNMLCLKREYTVWMKLIFIAIQVIISASVNTLGFIGWLPVIAACIFTWMLDTENEVVLKAVIVLTQIMWGIYDMSISNYAALMCDFFTVISNAIGILMIRKQYVNA